MSTYTPIASITLASAASSVTFSGIPQTYTDLVLVAMPTNNSGDTDLGIRFNDDTGSNYSSTFMYGIGSGSGSSVRNSNQTRMRIGRVGVTTPMPNIIHIQNYSNSTTNKTAISRSQNESSAEPYLVLANVGLWRNTAAVTTITLINDGGQSFQSGNTFNLYGIANASITNVAKATGGDSVYTDGTYWYHIFNSSGTFTPTRALTVDYLVVAGGGGGGVANFAGNATSGGGGAGGYRTSVGTSGGGSSAESALSLTTQAYTVTIGAGGSGSAAQDSDGTNGSNSVFSTITSTGGGYGSSRNVAGTNRAPSSGGSGGGGGLNINGGAGTANQGYAGGNPTDTNNSGAGGGGAGGVGGNSGANVAGVAGVGLSSSISGSSVTRATGGRGRQTNAVDGTANTGNGGDGGSTGGTPARGGNGGSGIIVIRYSAA